MHNTNTLCCGTPRPLHASLLQTKPAEDEPVVSKLVSGGKVVQLYRYPGLSLQSAATLLHQVRPRGTWAPPATVLDGGLVVQLAAEPAAVSGFQQSVVCLLGGLLARAVALPGRLHQPPSSWHVQPPTHAHSCTSLPTTRTCSHVPASQQAQHKVSDAITAIDGELCYNIALDTPLSAKEAGTLAW